MAAKPDEPIVLQVDAVDHIFNAPDANPFGAGESSILGEAGLDLLLLRLQTEPRRKLEGVPLVVKLPAGQITPELETQLASGIQRYCATRIEDNQLRIRHSRLQHSIGLAVVIGLVLLVALIALILLSTVLADAPAVVQGLVGGMVCVFTWVILWDPLEALLFEWVEPTRENRMLEKIMTMRVCVQPQP